MKCPSCEFENREGAKFCKRCGKRLDLQCPSCGSPYQPDSIFCDACGQDLREPKASTRPDYTQPPSYTPKHLADKILTSRSALEGERKLVTVLFADVASYTALSEKLDPEEVHQIMDDCFQLLMEQIHRYEGTINQFTGDGVMALFGAPLAHEDHAQRACHAALAIQKAMADYGTRVQKQYSHPFRLRIGLHSGPVVVGKIGDDLRMDYTAIGDTTNLASRMQGVAQPGTILASAHTHHLAQDFFVFSSLGPLPIKGKEEPQEAYQLLGSSPVETRLAASVAKGLTRFVGRTREIQSLQEAYAKVKSGSGQVIGLVGEAGVGKSRLLWEFRSLLPPGEPLYLEGHCLHYGGSMAYLPILDMLRSYFEIREGDREVPIKKKLSEKVLSLDSHLQNVLAPVQELLSLKVDDESFLQLEPRQRKERTFEALRDLLIRQSQEGPLILAIEDLQWTDKTSEEFFSYLIDWLAKAQILLVLLYRPEYTYLWGSKSHYTRIGLDQLSLNLSAELVQEILEGGEVAPELKQLLLDRAAGNPLFLEELTHSLLENGSIQKQDHRFILSQKPSDLQVPDTIQGIVAARMDRLEENLKRTMQFASVIGRDFAFRILQMITGMREDLKSHLLNLQGLEFIYEKSLFPELEYIFKHALTQEVAYQSLLLKRRKEIHQRIGEAIEDLYPERLEEFYGVLAYHFEKAGVSDKAVKYLHLAGERATRLSANEEAIACFHRGLELLQMVPESPGRDEHELTLQLDLMAPLAATKGWSVPEMRDVGSRALDLARRIGDTARAFSALCLLRYCYLSQAEVQTTLQMSEELLHLAQRSQDPVQNILAHWAMGVTLYFMGELDRSRVHLEQVIVSYDPQKYPTLRFLYIQDPGVNAGSYLALIHLHMGFPDQALQRSQEVLALARGLNHPFSLGYALQQLGCWLHHGRGEPQIVHDYAVELMQMAIENKFPLLQAQAIFLLGWCRVQQGEVEAGIAQMEQGAAAWQNAGMRISVPSFLHIIAAAYGRAGQVDKGLALLDEAATQVEKTGERRRGAGLYRIKGDLLASSNRISEAEASFRKAIEVARRQQAKFLELQATIALSRLLQQEGRSEEARTMLSEIYGWFTEGFDTPVLQEARALLESL